MSSGSPNSPAPSSYLQQRQAQAATELAQAETQLESLRAEAERYYPPCEAAAGQMQATLKAAAAQRAEELRSDARKAARGKALKLQALVSNGKLRLLIWVALLVPLPWLAARMVYGPLLSFSTWLTSLGGITLFGPKLVFFLIPSGLAYWGLVKWGISLQGDRNSRVAREAVLAFGNTTLSLMHFGDRESGDARYPYQATRAPWPNKAITTQWNIDQKFGKQFGADFVVFHQGSNVEEPHSLLRLPAGGQAATLIPIKARTGTAEWALQEQLAKSAANALAALAAPIRTLSTHAESWSKELARVRALQQRMKTLQDVQENWTDVAIDEPVLDQVLKLVDLFASGRKPSPKGVLLYGPPGTGKTLIARKLAKHAGCHFEAVNIADLKGEHIGSTAPKVKAIWERCRKEGPTLLFVDECESAFARRGSVDTDSFGNELVQTFISEWDGFNQASGQVFVIGATNRRDILDDAVVSRFTATVEIGLPNAESRKRILQHELSQANIDMEVSPAVITETSGMSGRDLHTMIAAVIADNLDRELKPEALINEIRRVRGKGSTQVQELSWDDIVLPPTTREEFESLGHELRDAEQMSKLGIPPPEGILLYGPPGTGKTQIARVLASQSGLSFVGASTADMKANYLGQSGSKVKALFERARSQAPCILFIDEIDIVAPARDGGGNDALTQEVVGQLLQELDGVASKKGQVFLLAASNHPDRIDSALLSRLDRQIKINLPDAAARAAILALELNGKPIAFEAQTAAKTFAERTEGWSGRDLHKLVSRATRKAVARTRRAGNATSETQLEMVDLEASLEARDEAA